MLQRLIIGNETEEVNSSTEGASLFFNRPSKPTSKDKKGASVVGQGGVKDKRSKGVGGREVLIQLGRGDEKNNNNKEKVAKKRTTVNESLAGGDRIQTLDATQGIGNRRPVRSSAKKAVGWYLEEEQDSHSHPIPIILCTTLLEPFLPILHTNSVLHAIALAYTCYGGRLMRICTSQL